jgi:hypothetical protein
LSASLQPVRSTPIEDTKNGSNYITDGTLGLTSVSGFGAVVGFLVPELMADGKSLSDIIHLITYPALFMGLGNFVSMPVASPSDDDLFSCSRLFSK